MFVRRWRLPALGLTLCLTLGLTLLASALAGCAQANVPSQRPTPTSAPTSASGASGLRVVVRLNCPANLDCGAFSAALSQTLAALAKRARRGLGVSGATATTLSDGDVRIDLPGYTNQQLAVSALTAQGAVQFIDVGQTPLAVGTTVAAKQFPVLFTGAQIDPSSVQATLDQNNSPSVVFEFAGSARSVFATYTRDHAGDALTITQDNVVIESATIQSEIDGQGEITGFKTLTAAKTLAAELKSVPLPEPVSLVSAKTFGA